MAIAISVPQSSAPQAGERTVEATAALWTSISAAVALAATIPLIAMLSGPLSSVLFVRGTEYDGSWGYASLALLVLLAPATYAIFFVTTGEMLKDRVEELSHKRITRFAAAALAPYLVMVIGASYWTSGPQLALMITAAFTIPIAMAATIWVSAQNHRDARG